MSYTNTNTRAFSNTYTESRSRYVMGKAYEDFLGIYFAGLILKERANKWREDILYILDKQTLKSFEIQFTKPNGEQCGILYEVVNNSLIYNDDESGGFDYYSLPDKTFVSIVINLDEDSKNYNEVNKELNNRGWGNNGVTLSGSNSFEKSYSKDGFGFNQSKIGNW